MFPTHSRKLPEGNPFRESVESLNPAGAKPNEDASVNISAGLLRDPGSRIRRIACSKPDLAAKLASLLSTCVRVEKILRIHARLPFNSRKSINHALIIQGKQRFFTTGIATEVDLFVP